MKFFVGSVVSPIRTDTHNVNEVEQKVKESVDADKGKRNRRRHFVNHRYHDHSYETDPQVNLRDDLSCSSIEKKKKGGWSMTFPEKLHLMLDDVDRAGLDWVVSWQPHGRAFLVHNREEFVTRVMPKYFNQTRLTSFQRQLNLYGFLRITRGADAGAYYHELFLRGKSFLCKRIIRCGVKGTGVKASNSPGTEPDFYKMPLLLSPGSVTSDKVNKVPSAGFVDKSIISNRGEKGSEPKRFDSNGIVLPSFIHGHALPCSSTNSMMQQDNVKARVERVRTSHGNGFEQVQNYGLGVVSFYNTPREIQGQDRTQPTNLSGLTERVDSLWSDSYDGQSVDKFSDNETNGARSASDGKAALDSLDPLSLLLRHTFGEVNRGNDSDDDALVSTATSHGFSPDAPRCGVHLEELDVNPVFDFASNNHKLSDGFEDESSKMSDSELGNLLDVICDEL